MGRLCFRWLPAISVRGLSFKLIRPSIQGARSISIRAKVEDLRPLRGSPMSMSAEEKFFFDLEGFIHIRGVLSPEEVAEANIAIDEHRTEIRERLDPNLRNTQPNSPLAGDPKHGRRELAGMLGWADPHCRPFRNLLTHPKILPYLTELLGPGYRMDHLPFIILQNRGSEGFSLHGGPLIKDKFNPTLQYRCVNGQMYNSLLAMSVQLADHNPGDGGFCVVPGSHKMNFPVPDDLIHGRRFTDHVQQPVTKAGDAVLFSEATVHGALPWTADHERRVALYRFAPATVAYGRSYAPSWPDAMMKGLTAAQRAVLEPPYANRLDRPQLRQGAENPVIEGRSAPKQEWDKEVFGTNYF